MVTLLDPKKQLRTQTPVRRRTGTGANDNVERINVTAPGTHGSRQFPPALAAINPPVSVVSLQYE